MTQFTLPLITIPPIIALMAKGTIYAYAQYSRIHNRQTRLYLLFLLSFSIQNLAEVFGLYRANVDHIIPYHEATIFYVAVIVALAIFVHLTLVVAFDDDRGGRKLAILFAYLYAVLLVFLLIGTRWLIGDFEVLDYGLGLSITRVPGPLYPLFELYVFATLLGSVGVLGYGLRKQSSASKRAKNLILLSAIVPTVVTALLVVALLHLGIKWFNTSIIFPMTITFFLAVTAYAIHQHRLFDIEFFLPWSKVHARKTAFYDRIRAMVAEIADVPSVNQMVNRLADTLHCPVALMGSGSRPVLIMAGEAFGMARFPPEALQRIDRIVVANEIADALPETHALMNRHKVAAIVPFHPHSQTAASWMLLGEHFSEQVYSPLDFKVVEQLFDRLAELFLDKLLLMRAQLADTQREMRSLHQRLANAWDTQAELRKENQRLREQNSHLMNDQISAVESSLLAPAPGATATASGELFVPEEKTLDDYVAEFEARIIEQALERCHGNQSKAARLLGIRPNTLYYKIGRYGLDGKKNAPK